MNAAAMQTRLVAFCGVDGAGKSTLVDLAASAGLAKSTIGMRRTKSPRGNSALIAKYAARHHGNGRDWLDGPFCETVAMALAFEFLEYYEEELQPSFGRYELILCDRYSICFSAYLKLAGHQDALGLLSGVRAPDHIFYVHLPFDELKRRQGKRGFQQDEDPEVMRAYHRAYLELLPRYRPNVTFIKNSGTPEDALNVVKRVLTNTSINGS